MTDARTGFRIALTMDVVLFVFGILLISCAAAIAVVNQYVNSWPSVAITGAIGLLTILYTLFIGKPRQQVKAATDHMM